jgi:hypothetical protein
MTAWAHILMAALTLCAVAGSLVLALTTGFLSDWALVGETGPSAGTGLPFLLVAGAYAAFLRKKKAK